MIIAIAQSSGEQKTNLSHMTMQALSNKTLQSSDSVIRHMTRVSNRYGVINLSQGFLDFDPPREITDRLAEKTYSITGWRFSYTIASTGISERIKKVRDQRAGQWAQGTIR